MIDIQKYIQNMEVLGQCVFQIYNNDFSYKERHCMIKKTLEAYKESRLDLFPYDELADYFSQEICKYNGGLQNYTIDRLLVRFGCYFLVFILDEFREDIEHPTWDDVCQKVQMFFIVFAEVLRAAGRTDKIEQVPNVSYMKTMLEELEIQPDNEAKQQQYSKELVDLFHRHRELIDELVGKSDKEIATSIKKWAKTKDDSGRPLIENPSNRMQSAFAKELKQNGLIKLSEESFRKKL